MTKKTNKQKTKTKTKGPLTLPSTTKNVRNWDSHITAAKCKTSQSPWKITQQLLINVNIHLV